MRLFVAVPVEDALAASLQQACQALKKNGLSAVRWLPRENWHLTAFFLGDGFSREQAQVIADRLAKGLPELSAFEAPLETIDWFPAAERPAVLAGLFGRNLMLQALHDEVYQALKELDGVKKPKNRFAPHISLARPNAKKIDLEKVGDPPLPMTLEDAWLSVDHVELWRSVHGPDGVHYECLGRGDLAPG
ncbi:2'-5' RNA ligase [Sulfurivirga caldicuralii]|uniref:RNA 2',3'-cyclic phosphodiesterase n=1 Tax=Sulfurivirga caldicuralii TaxID=364032 RepID=A0A1N6EZF6_9GAMM|nr:RNA 2',3'-cyclic phosphodiesterase [Sulfurivirga caldicuralii]SIN88410.1 2'-5' RNA ligase [Sulfurivirga caldicuralii]